MKSYAQGVDDTNSLEEGGSDVPRFKILRSDDPDPTERKDIAVEFNGWSELQVRQAHEKKMT